MKKLIALFILIFGGTFVYAQNNPLEKFGFLIGKWEGTGSGFSSSTSVIHSEFNWMWNKQFIEIKNHSEFKPTTENPEGEIHDDWGVVSYDKSRNTYVFRQFHGEGFVNQYILNDSLSTDKSFIFESEIIENFVPGGTARFTINIKKDTQIETLFDVGFPGKEMACFGNNQLKKNNSLHFTKS